MFLKKKYPQPCVPDTSSVQLSKVLKNLLDEQPFVKPCWSGVLKLFSNKSFNIRSLTHQLFLGHLLWFHRHPFINVV